VKTTVSVSLSGDQAIISFLRAIAAKRGKTIGEIVRFAIDATYAEDIAALSIFFAKNGQSNFQTETDKESNNG
jgi:hypothetical protein